MAQPMKLAIIGGGPSGFYVASRILSLTAAPLQIHVFDRLWAPHGLVRYGVAPDHPEVKNCTHKFDSTAEDPRFRFFGNVNVGDAGTSIPHAVQVPLASVFKNYTHVLFSTGCAVPTAHEALPSSKYCIPGLSVVHWYTQHASKPDPPPLADARHVSIIGNGNVSLDIARMLLTDISMLSKYDVQMPVLDVLAQSRVKHISIIARRGPLEAAFTVKELRELINLPDTSMVPLEPALLDPLPSTTLTRQQTRVLQLLSKGSKIPYPTSSKTWSLDFYRSPTGLVRPYPDSSSLQLSLAHTIVDPQTKRAVPTGDVTTLDTDLVITSLGFHAEPMAPFYDPALGHLRTIGERVISSSGAILKNVYASGWAALGAKGVLATTMMNAYAAADAILTDWMPGPAGAGAHLIDPSHNLIDAEEVLNAMPPDDDPPEEVTAAMKKGLIVNYEDWKKLDEEEARRGERLGKERERMGWDEARTFLAETHAN